MIFIIFPKKYAKNVNLNRFMRGFCCKYPNHYDWIIKFFRITGTQSVKSGFWTKNKNYCFSLQRFWTKMHVSNLKVSRNHKIFPFEEKWIHKTESLTVGESTRSVKLWRFTVGLVAMTKLTLDHVDSNDKVNIRLSWISRSYLNWQMENGAQL